MVSFIKFAIVLIWVPQALRQALNWIYWWQVKEYRLDRFWIFLKTHDGRKSLLLRSVFAKVFLLLATFFYPLVFLVVLILFLVLDFKFFLDSYTRVIRKPVFTERGKKIFGTSIFILILSVFLGYKENVLISLLFGEVSLLVSSYFGILWTVPIVNKIKKEEITKAKKALQLFKPSVIGVTGSYGKTTTKEFISHLLSQKYTTAKTEGSENTEFGIARKTYKNVTKGTQFFVVEMGAYKIGEIRKLSEIVSPKVGVITGIEEQHLSLFGSLENIKKAKFELIESLPERGIAIFNLSNEYCRELYEWAKELPTRLRVLGYYLWKDRADRRNKRSLALHARTYEVRKMSADISTRVISASEDRVKFEVSLGKERKVFITNLSGVHFVENLTAAILIARIFGVSWEKIERGVKTITLPKGTMQVRKFADGAIVIDDTHNSTLRAFLSALDYLKTFKRKRVVITSGIIELGNKSYRFHREIGEKMRSVCDEVILTNRDFEKALIEGLGKDKNKLTVCENDKIFIKEMEQFKRDCVILLEGRVPTYVFDVLKLKR